MKMKKKRKSVSDEKEEEEIFNRVSVKITKARRVVKVSSWMTSIQTTEGR